MRNTNQNTSKAKKTSTKLIICAVLIAAAMISNSLHWMTVPSGEANASQGSVVTATQTHDANKTSTGGMLDFLFGTDTTPASKATTGTPNATNAGTGLPEYAGSPYAILNGNVPEFLSDGSTSQRILASGSAAFGYESYSAQDRLGRCVNAEAMVGVETIPTDKRGSIGQVKPTGWHTVKYDCVDGKYLYNRCHLLGYQLTAENANALNLITGTRYLNVDGMLPWENKVRDYIDRTGNHVFMRVRPVYVGDELVARGVQMEAYSLEDDGRGICFDVYCFNVQPSIEIDYSTGDSRLVAAR